MNQRNWVLYPPPPDEVTYLTSIGKWPQPAEPADGSTLTPDVTTWQPCDFRSTPAFRCPDVTLPGPSCVDSVCEHPVRGPEFGTFGTEVTDDGSLLPVYRADFSQCAACGGVLDSTLAVEIGIGGPYLVSNGTSATVVLGAIDIHGDPAAVTELPAWSIDSDFAEITSVSVDGLTVVVTGTATAGTATLTAWSMGGSTDLTASVPVTNSG